MQVNPLVSKLDRRYQDLSNSRSNWERHWQELADYMLPRKADITKKRTAGDKRTDLIYDGTAIHAVELLASSLHGMMTSPSSPWFSMQYRNPVLQRNDLANEWLEVCLDQMYKHFNRSNFQQEIHELYYDLVVFGTGAIYVDMNGDNLRFATRHIAEICIAEDANGSVDTVYRKFKMTARAMEQQFGRENLPAAVMKDSDKEPFKEHEIIHAVYPRGKAKGRDAK
ncbi:MAG: portal protein, partial [Marivita sp.]